MFSSTARSSWANEGFAALIAAKNMTLREGEVEELMSLIEPNGELDFESDSAKLPSSQSQTHSRAYPLSVSENSSAVGERCVPGSARWVKGRKEALEAERLALVEHARLVKERKEKLETERRALIKQALEAQGFVGSVQQKVRTAIDISDSLGMTTGDDDAAWAVESAQMLEEKQELVSLLIVYIQQGWQPFYSSLNL